MNNEDLEFIEELKDIVFVSQIPVELKFIDGTVVTLEPGDGGFDAWSTEDDICFYMSMDDFLDNFIVNGKPLRHRVCDIVSLS